jgi:hypothetical protein
METALLFLPDKLFCSSYIDTRKGYKYQVFNDYLIEILLLHNNRKKGERDVSGENSPKQWPLFRRE